MQLHLGGTQALAPRAPMLPQVIADIALVAHHQKRLQFRRQRLGLLAVGLLARRGQMAAHEAQAINGMVDVGGQPAPRTPDGFLSPAACAGRGAAALDAGAVDVQSYAGIWVIP